MPDVDTASLRILYSIAETHPCFRADVAVLFGKYLPRLGIRSDLVTLHHVAEAPTWGGGECLTLPGPSKGAKRHLLSVAGDLRMLWLAQRGYHAIIVRDKSLGALLGLLAARLAGIPFMYWMSFPMVEAWAVFARDRGLNVGLLRWLSAKTRATLLRWLLYRVVLPRADHVFAQSDVMLAELVAKGLPAARLSAVPMGVDTEAMPDIGSLRPDPSATAEPMFAYLGTLNRIRRPELMLEALAKLRARGVRARLLLVGDAEEESDRRWLREQIAEMGLQSCVEITGWLAGVDGLRRAAGAVAGLSPVPRTELLELGSPTKVVEYFHLGLPVVANDQPDQALLLRAAGGVCAPLTADGFADAMQDMLERPAHHQSVALAGQALVRARRSYAALAAQVAAVLRRTLSHK